ncbi:Ig-like domain repeat protein [Aeromicrobium sp. Root472D3]|uniref:Ig-like domain repeat protein n=1 Tax=Aeromicrobium sp. Root472D3 TaxID=1736540 RepID=UPI0009E87B7E|nr:Ig-like domain repeat protein [Aeromicrobium sp. Root472D3]
MIRQRVSLAVVGAVVATTGLTAGLATSASAAPTIYDPTFTPTSGDLAGAGSDTSEIVLDYLTKGHNGIDGFNAGKSTGRLASFAAGTDPATVSLKGGAAITRPNGSGAGKTLLYGANNNADLDFARSSSTLSAAEISGNLQQAAFAVDGLRLAVSSTGTNAPASISAATMVKIYDGSYKKWSDIPGYAGPAPSAAIVPLIPQSGSGTRSFFVAQLKAANGGNDVALGSAVQNTQEHSDVDVKGNPNAIAPFSTARAKGSTTVTTLTAEGSFAAQRAIYNVVRQADRAGSKGTLIASAFGSDGFLCSTAAKPLIEAAGFDQLATSANGGVCGTFGTADVTNLKTNAAAKQSTTVLSAVAQNDKSVKLTASVSASGDLPGGSVVFSEVVGDTTKQVGGKTTVISGTATITLPATTSGTHVYSAAFTPSSPASYVASSSNKAEATVLKTSAVSAGAVSTTFGQGASIPVRVTADGAAAAGGTVTVNAGGAVSTVAVSGGAATVAVPSTLAAGSYTVTVAYSGDSSTSASSTATSLSVAKASSATSLKLAKKVKASKKAKATVTVKAPGSVSGKVTLKVGSKTVGTGTVKNGKATITVKKLKKGSYKVKAVFAGGSNVNGSTSKTLKLKVTK